MVKPQSLHASFVAHSLGLGSSIHRAAAVLHALGCTSAYPWAQSSIVAALCCSGLPFQRLYFFSANDFGLFLSDEDPKKGIWLEAGKALDYYMLRNGDTMEYKKKQRPLKIRMLDGTVKTVMVDDSKTVTDMLMTICARIGITNYDEYSLVREIMEEKKEEVTGTLKKDKTLLRDEKKMEKLKQKLHTDDELNWLDHGRTLREQGIDDNETLLLRRKFFYSDQNVDSRDPVQLNLLYVQARDDILNGSHPVSFDKACEFAGHQCQIQFGPYNEQKHKPGFLE